MDAIVNVAAGDSTAGLILRQKKLIERYEAALERIAGIDESEWAKGDGWKCLVFVQGIAREALGEQVTA